jgi:hypothetical protein
MRRQHSSFRFRLSERLLEAAHEKAAREDLALAQVVRRLPHACVVGEIEIPPYAQFEGEVQDNDTETVWLGPKRAAQVLIPPTRP